MPALFVLPKQVPLTSSASLLAGAKLLFSATGSSTPQNTYTDILLATPSANPVIADANGVFAPIYLDPSLPNYRVILKTSADVVLYTVDDVPSNQNTAQQFRLKATAPSLIFEETDAAANNKKWRISVNNQQLTIDLGNDAESVWTNLATLTRIDGIPQTLNFAGGALTVGGQQVVAYDTDPLDQFTATVTGMTVATTGLIDYFSIGGSTGGGLVMLRCTAAIIGTSNTTACTITGIPAAIRALIAAKKAHCFITDAGTVKGGTAFVDLAGTITLGLGVDGTTLFTAAGFKGLQAGFFLVFPR